MTFRRLIPAVIVLAALAVSAFGADTSDWTMGRYDEAQTGYTPEKLSPPLTLCWQYDGTKFDNNPSAPAVSKGVAYFASGDRVYALDSKTGELKWQYPSSEGLKSSIKTGITVWEDRVFFGATDGNVYAINTETGQATWAFSTQRPVKSTPVVYNGIVYVGSDDNNLYAIDARTGQMAWSGPFKTKDDCSTPPAISPGMVVFASLDSNIYGANEASGRMRWAFQLPMAAMKAGPVVNGSLVIVGSGREIYILGTKNGAMRYKIALESDVVAPLAMAGNDIYVVCRNKKMYSFTVGLSGFKKKWETPVNIGAVTYAPPTVADKIIYVGSTHGLIGAYSTDDGRELWRYAVAPSMTTAIGVKPDAFTDITAPIVVADGALFVVTDDGSLHCFRPESPDQTAPRIYNVSPQSGLAMSGFPPLRISAVLYDDGTGVDPASIEMLIDEEKKDCVFDPYTLTVSYDLPITQPLVSLDNGRHALTVTAKDWKGNAMSYSWSIVIDNSLPRRPLPKSRTTGTGTKPNTGGTTGGYNPGGNTGPTFPPTPDSGGPPPPPMPGGGFRPGGGGAPTPIIVE